MKTEKYEIKLVDETKVHSFMINFLDKPDTPIIVKQIAANEAYIHGNTCIEYGSEIKKQQFEVLGLELLVQVGCLLKSYDNSEFRQTCARLVRLYEDTGDEFSLGKFYTNWAKRFLELDLTPIIMEQIQLFLNEAHRFASYLEFALDEENQPEWYEELLKTTSLFEKVKFQFENT
tara:strand:- start:170 stop:694 length:525 start_codon:yes stop_codon:yes gene_type:complete